MFKIVYYQGITSHFWLELQNVFYLFIRAVSAIYHTEYLQAKIQTLLLFLDLGFPGFITLVEFCSSENEEKHFQVNS